MKHIFFAALLALLTSPAYAEGEAISKCDADCQRRAEHGTQKWQLSDPTVRSPVEQNPFHDRGIIEYDPPAWRQQDKSR